MDPPVTVGDTVLADAERSALEACAEVVFPCISTGVYGYPKVEACDIAVSTVLEWLESNEFPERVVFCCFTDSHAEVYRARLARVGDQPGARPRRS